MLRIRQLLSLLVGLACADNSPDEPAKADTSLGLANLVRSVTVLDSPWKVQPLQVAPDRFRPAAWSSETVLWGLVRGRVTRLDTQTGAVSTVPQTGWSFFSGRGVASWRNEKGTWMLRDSGKPVLLAGPEPDSATGFDGPPTVLWSPDGTRALLAWHGEWDSHYRLLERDGSTRKLQVATPGYYGNAATLWLDSARVLFRTVANGPLGGEPTYRESGWRTDLAVLDLNTGAYTRVTSVPDPTHLRVAGRYLDRVVVTEWHLDDLRGFWLYDPRTWQRRPASLPKGRAFASAGGAVVILLDADADSSNAVLVNGSNTTELGRVARDAEPAFSPSGRRGALRTGRGVMVFEAR